MIWYAGYDTNLLISCFSSFFSNGFSYSSVRAGWSVGQLWAAVVLIGKTDPLCYRDIGTVAQYSSRDSPFFSLIPVIFARFFSASPSRVVFQIPGDQAGSSPLPPPSTLPYIRAFIFSREKTWAVSSLVDSHRFAPTHAARHSPLSSRFLLTFCFANMLKMTFDVGFEPQSLL